MQYIDILNFRFLLKLAHSKEEVESFIDALSKRLLNSESQALKNEILVNKVISAMQLHLHKLEEKKYNEISQQSKDEAVRIVRIITKYIL